MPSSQVHTFADPGEYAAAIRATTIDLTVTARGHFTGKRIRIDLHRLWMQRLFENTPRTLHSAFVTGRAIVTFPIHPGPALHWSGAALQPSNIIRHIEGETAFQRSSGPTSWGAMSLPVADMISFGAAIAGLDLTPPKDPLFLTPSPIAMAKVQRLHAAAGHLAEDAPEIIANPDAARGLEQALIEALIGCLADGEARENSLAQGQHAIVMRRFRRVVEENSEQPSTFRRSARRSGFRSGRCAYAARSIWEWPQSATCCCAACIWRGARCARQRPMRHQSRT